MLENVAPGKIVDVPVTLYSPGYDMWGFDFLFSYDPSALSLISVEEGPEFYSDSGCRWEYFEYRYGPNMNCGNFSCPSGHIRVVGLADLSPPQEHPLCLNPGKEAAVFSLKFLVTNDFIYNCTLLPIRFIWFDCGDNLISYFSNIDSLWYKQFYAYGTDVYFGDTLIGGTDSFPTFGGPPDSCIYDRSHISFGEQIIFHNGGVFIECDDTEPLIGDVNANSVAYEVADALLFSNYFIYGESIFTIALEDQIAATDINRDGETLKLEDYTQLIRIILGYIVPDSTIDSTLDGSIVNNDKATKTVSLHTDYFVDAIWIKMSGDIEPYHPTDSSLLGHNYDGSHTRILLGKYPGYGPGNVDLFTYTGEGEIVAAQAATNEGIEITLRIDDVVTSIEEPDDILPSAFALHQNYPNPFNIETTIKFDLPRASEVEFEIINILGQVVYDVSRRYSAGSHTINWDGSSNLGQTVGSGVYYYRITAGDFVSSKKMILLK